MSCFSFIADATMAAEPPVWQFEFSRHANDSMTVRFEGAQVQYLPVSSHAGCTNASRVYEIAAGDSSPHLVRIGGTLFQVLPSGGSQFSIYECPPGPLHQPLTVPITAKGFTLHNHDSTKHVTFVPVQPFVLVA
jgi:hypothetical protein